MKLLSSKKKSLKQKQSSKRKTGTSRKAQIGSIIHFGTDGWRGKIAEDYTFDNVRRCTQGFAGYLKSAYSSVLLQRGVVVGGDRRFNSEFFAAAAAEVLAGNGIPVHFCGGGVPTPVISFSVKARNAIAAINITASHNPPGDNGFKVRDENGGAIAPDGLKKIEKLIPKNSTGIKQLKFADGKSSGLIKEFNADGQYIEQIKKMVDLGPIKNAGLKILVDPMWGNGAGWFSRLIGG
ncbi:MAG TPA: hypothetical protein VKI62_07675, partial [Bacteroidota bacterium]|nr:hypothetical protein [Bacteroidota bacterium]